MNNRMHYLERVLTDPNIYRQQIEVLRKRFDKRNIIYELEQDGVNFFSMVIYSNQLSKKIAKSVKNESYKLSEVVQHKILTNNKVRDICQFCLTDRILQSAMYAALKSELQSYTHLNVYSYLPGKSTWMATRELSQYIKQHRDLYLVRTDMTSYTDNIPVHPNSPLWPIFDEFLTHSDPDGQLSDYMKNLLRNVLRPSIRCENGGLYQNLVGIPMGITLCGVIANIYLKEIDIFASNISGGKYIRYGDDLVFMHPDKSVVLEVDDIINIKIAPLGLSRNPDKDQFVYFTKPGRPCDDSKFQGTSSINYLGFSIGADGSLSVKSEYLKNILASLKQRLYYTNNLLGDLMVEEKGRLLCRAISDALNPRHKLLDPKLSGLLQRCDNRERLKQIDYLLALEIAQLLSGIKGVRSFRKFPYKMIREKWGLPSLYHYKSNSGKRKR